jgi:hypothetical protein
MANSRKVFANSIALMPRNLCSAQRVQTDF